MNWFNRVWGGLNQNFVGHDPEFFTRISWDTILNFLPEFRGTRH